MLLTIELEVKEQNTLVFVLLNCLRPELPQTLYSERLVSDLAEELEADETDFRLVVVVAEIFHCCFEGI